MSSSSDDSDYEDLDSSSDDESVVNVDVPKEQWVKFIEFYSAQSKCDQSIRKGTTVEKLCQATDENFGEYNQNKPIWILNNNNQEEILIISFETPVFINEIHIYESLNPGSIIKIDMLESQQNKWWTMWQRKTRPEKQSITYNIFKPLLRRYHNQSNTIRLTLDPRYTDKIGIQAIKLLGSNIFDTTFHQKSLPQSMTKLYEQALKNMNTDIKFKFNDKIIGAHRNILCCRSPYFRSLLLNDFVEKYQKEPIELTDINYETFLEILFFIYTGTYHSTITFDIAQHAMIYSNKINFLSAKNVAMEHICRYLRLHHDSIIPTYCLVKEMSPAFDLLLEYIYDLCSENLNVICKQKDFIDLDKGLMIDIISKSTERREIREQENKQRSLVQGNSATNHGNEEEEEEEEEE